MRFSPASMFRAARALALAILPALAACGGGGGGGSPVPAAPTALVITSSNAKPVSADAMSAADTNGQQGAASLVTGVQVNGQSAGAAAQLGAAARTLLALVPAQPAVATGVAINTNAPCTLGGSINLTGSQSGTSSLIAGDNLTIAASQCHEIVNGVDTLLNGTLGYTITAGVFNSQVSYPYHVAMQLTATNLSLTEGSQVETLNGDMLMDLSATSATVESVTYSGSSLSTGTGTTGAVHTVTIKSYNETVSINNGVSSANVSGTVVTTNARLGSGSFTYSVSTPTTWVVDASGNVTAGSLKVTGSQSALLVTVTSTNNFSIQVDTNGDGTYDETQTATQTELQGLL